MPELNVFKNPEKHIKKIFSKVRIPEKNLTRCTGKAFASVFPTKRCPAGCPHCFFQSGMGDTECPSEMAEYSEHGMEQLIKFFNQANLGYLLVVGGGEPFQTFHHVIKLVKEVETDRIVVVTNGMWGRDRSTAEKKIRELHKALMGRKTPTHLVLRLSVDQEHVQQLGRDLVINIIGVFREYFKDEEHFELQLHGLMGDAAIDEIANLMGDARIEESTIKVGVTDNDTVMKISPNRRTMSFGGDDYTIQIGMANRFYPSMAHDLSDPDADEIQRALKVFHDDMQNSSQDNPAVILNTDGSYGHNWWFDYNGNGCTYGNQQPTDQGNVYIHDYADFEDMLYGNIITYSVLDKGYTYRVERIAEVNPRAVLRAEAMNIRDYSGAALLEESKTVLYYAIRVIQDYLAEGTLTMAELQGLSPELVETIAMDRETLKKTYESAEHTIFEQYMSRTTFSEKDWQDLFVLVSRGHYEGTAAQIEKALSYYNSRATVRFNNISEVPYDALGLHRRRTALLNPMNPEAKYRCITSA